MKLTILLIALALPTTLPAALLTTWQTDDGITAGVTGTQNINITLNGTTTKLTLAATPGPGSAADFEFGGGSSALGVNNSTISGSETAEFVFGFLGSETVTLTGIDFAGINANGGETGSFTIDGGAAITISNPNSTGTGYVLSLSQEIDDSTTFLFTGDTGNYRIDNFRFSVVPEPSTWTLLTIGMSGLIFWRLHKRRLSVKESI